ncbi:MAG: Tripartite tricarboxylate transporter TctB family [Pseudomonadota bacterium]|jgi:hypothetical protein
MSHLDRKLTVLIMLAFFAAIVWAGTGYGPSAGLAPVAAGIIGLLCVIPELFLEFKPAQSRDEDQAIEPQHAREVVMLAWVVALVLMVLGVGLVIAAMLFVLAYTRWGEQHTWRLSLLLTIGVGGFIHGVFDRLLQITLYQGWLARLWL